MYVPENLVERDIIYMQGSKNTQVNRSIVTIQSCLECKTMLESEKGLGFASECISEGVYFSIKGRVSMFHNIKTKVGGQSIYITVNIIEM